MPNQNLLPVLQNLDPQGYVRVTAMTRERPRKRRGKNYVASMNVQFQYSHGSARVQLGEVKYLGTTVRGQSSESRHASAVVVVGDRRIKVQNRDQKQLIDSRLKRMNEEGMRLRGYSSGSRSCTGIKLPVGRLKRFVGELGGLSVRTTDVIKCKSARARVAVLERFDGVVDVIEGETAFVTLTSKSGEELIGEYPASELAKLGIHGRRRFICKTVVAKGKVEVRFQAIPDLEVTADEEAAIDQELDELISGGELDGAY